LAFDKHNPRLLLVLTFAFSATWSFASDDTTAKDGIQNFTLALLFLEEDNGPERWLG
jgi:hypothetical protein